MKKAPTEAGVELVCIKQKASNDAYSTAKKERKPLRHEADGAVVMSKAETEKLATELAMHFRLKHADRNFLYCELLRFGALSYQEGWKDACEILEKEKAPQDAGS